MSRGGNKWKVLYKCVDCDKTRFMGRAELDRHTKPRCWSCGSTFLEPCSSNAKEQEVVLATHRVAPPPVMKHQFEN
jgi:DNA-directed RNA polymerase subunit RPC12/RpoP